MSPLNSPWLLGCGDPDDRLEPTGSSVDRGRELGPYSTQFNKFRYQTTYVLPPYP